MKKRNFDDVLVNCFLLLLLLCTSSSSFTSSSLTSYRRRRSYRRRSHNGFVIGFFVNSDMNTEMFRFVMSITCLSCSFTRGPSFSKPASALSARRRDRFASFIKTSTTRWKEGCEGRWPNMPLFRPFERLLDLSVKMLEVFKKSF